MKFAVLLGLLGVAAALPAEPTSSDKDAIYRDKPVIARHDPGYTSPTSTSQPVFYAINPYAFPNAFPYAFPYGFPYAFPVVKGSKVEESSRTKRSAEAEAEAEAEAKADSGKYIYATPYTFPAGTPYTFPAGMPYAFPAGTPYTFPAGMPYTFPAGTPYTFPAGMPYNIPAPTAYKFPVAKIPAASPYTKVFPYSPYQYGFPFQYTYAAKPSTTDDKKEEKYPKER